MAFAEKISETRPARPELESATSLSPRQPEEESASPVSRLLSRQQSQGNRATLREWNRDQQPTARAKTSDSALRTAPTGDTPVAVTPAELTVSSAPTTVDSAPAPSPAISEPAPTPAGGPVNVTPTTESVPAAPAVVSTPAAPAIVSPTNPATPAPPTMTGPETENPVGPPTADTTPVTESSPVTTPAAPVTTPASEIAPSAPVLTPVVESGPPGLINDLLPSPGTTVVPAHEAADNGDVPGLILEDRTDALPEQMTKSVFLDQLEIAIREAADEKLAGTPYTAQNCPYIVFWFQYYRQRSGRHVERALRRFAPETAGVLSAEEYIPLVTERVRNAVARWANTGEFTGLPTGVSLSNPLAVPATEASDSPLPQQALAGNPGREQRYTARSGEPLESGVRSRMESVFQTSFSDVRVHRDAAANQSSDALNARAYAVGQDVTFSSGEYRPGTPAGDALIAHELAHVVQQQGAAPAASTAASPLAASAELEQDAEHATHGAVAALWGKARAGMADIARNALPRLRSGLRLARCSRDRTATGPMRSTAFSATVSGPLNISDLGARAEAASPTYNASGTIEGSFASDTDAADWETGFLQTVYASERDAHYVNAAGNLYRTRRDYDTTLPVRDGDAGILPWYGNETKSIFTSAHSNANPSMSDTPATRPPWLADDGVGQLKAGTGLDHFTSWMIARQMSTGNIVYFNWADWQVDYTATFNFAAKTGAGTGTGSKVNDTGTGQGSNTPKLTDPVANDVARVEWTAHT